jgi:hypothetical protein
MLEAAAKAHIDDLLREAEHERLARRVRRTPRGRGVIRRGAGAVAAADLWTIRR